MSTQSNPDSIPLWMRLAALIAGLFIGLGLSWLWVNGREAGERTAAPIPADETAESILYLSPAGGGTQLWVVDLDTRDQRQVTDVPGEITGFSPAPDGSAVIIAVDDRDGTSSLQLVHLPTGEMTQLLECGERRCESPAWSVNGRIAFVWEGVGLETAQGIWVLDPDEGEEQLLREGRLHSPSWSPDGLWLAVLDDGQLVIRLMDVTEDRENLIPTSMGVMGSWAPGGQAFAYIDLLLSYEPIGRLYRVEFGTGEIVPIEPEGYEEADFGGVAWSPAGDQLAASVRRSGEGQGRRLLVMDPDGETLQVIAEELDVVYGGAHWNRDGRLLTFQRFDLQNTDRGPSVLIWSEEGGLETVAEQGYLPVFLP